MLKNIIKECMNQFEKVPSVLCGFQIIVVATLTVDHLALSLVQPFVCFVVHVLSLVKLPDMNGLRHSSTLPHNIFTVAPGTFIQHIYLI